MSAADNVFFIRTTHEARLSPVEQCSVLSTAAKNPTRRINLFSNSLPCDGGFGDLDGEEEGVGDAGDGSGADDGVAAGVALPGNVFIVRFNYTDIFAALPHMLRWYKSRAWDEQYRDSILSDATRLALLHRFGGVYLDTDVLSLRPLDGLVNAVVLEDPWMINNAVLAFERGHDFLLSASVEFVVGFNAGWWGWNGPRLITRMWWRHAGLASNNIALVPIVEAYPITWRDSNVLFEPVTHHPAVARRIFTHTRVVHVWNRITSTKLAELTAEAGQAGLHGLLIHAMMDVACPMLHRHVEGGDNIADEADAFLVPLPTPATIDTVFTSATGHDAKAQGAAPARFRVRGLSRGEVFDGSATPGTFTSLTWYHRAMQAWGKVWDRGGGVSVRDGGDGDEGGDAKVRAAAAVWSTLDIQPAIQVVGGAVLAATQRRGELELMKLWHRGTLYHAMNGLEWQGVMGECGVTSGTSMGLHTHAIIPVPPPLPAGGDWMLSLWITSRTLDWTMREWPHDTPRIPPDSLPNRELGIPPIPVPVASVQDMFALGPEDDIAASLVLAIEDGRVTVGDMEGEWLRSVVDVADLQWHHVALSVERVPPPPLPSPHPTPPAASGGRLGGAAPPAGRREGMAGGAAAAPGRGNTTTTIPYIARISLFVDGMLHAHRDVTRPQAGLAPGGGRAGGGGVPGWRRVLLGSSTPTRLGASPLVYMDEVITVSLGDVVGGNAAARAMEAELAAQQRRGGGASPPTPKPKPRPRVVMPWVQDTVLRIRNTQLLYLASRPCSPFHLPGMVNSVSMLPPPPSSLPVGPAAQGSRGGGRISGQAGVASALHANAATPHARILVLVLSDGRPFSAHLRMAVRTGWGQIARDLPIRLLFVLSRAHELALSREATLYQDILMVGEADDYTQLSRKVMAAFRAAVTVPELVAGGYDFIIKTDHDIMLHVDVLQRELDEALQQHQAGGGEGRLRYWRGFVYRNIPPLRDMGDKNADVSSTIMTFPPYTAGVAYVMSMDVVRSMAALPSPLFTLNEDQNTGLWAAQVDGMEEAQSRGIPPLEPVHDIRFQQWLVCQEGQLAVHLQGRARPLMRLLTYNVERGKPLCLDAAMGTCCLCCPCSQAWLHSWFTCDATGAMIPEHISLNELTGLPHTTTLQLQDTASLHLALHRTNEARHAPMAPITTVATSPAEARALLPLPVYPFCAWEGGTWRVLGQGYLSPVALSVVSRGQRQDNLSSRFGKVDGHSSYPFAGVELRCTQSPRCRPVVEVETDVETDVEAAVATEGEAPGDLVAPTPPPRLPTTIQQCAAEIVFSAPPSERHCNWRQESPGIARRAGVEECWRAEDGFGRVSQGVAVCTPDDRAASRSGAWKGLWQRRFAPGQIAGVEEEVVLQWLLVTAVVDTHGACMPPPATVGAEESIQRTPLDRTYMHYPRYGAFPAFCGLFVDLRHTDGTVTTFRIPFARNASMHLMHEVVHVLHPESVMDATVTLIVPAWTGQTATVTVGELDITWMHVPPDRVPTRAERPQTRAAATNLHDSDPRQCLLDGSRDCGYYAFGALSLQRVVNPLVPPSPWLFGCAPSPASLWWWFIRYLMLYAAVVACCLVALRLCGVPWHTMLQVVVGCTRLCMWTTRQAWSFITCARPQRRITRPALTSWLPMEWRRAHPTLGKLKL